MARRSHGDESRRQVRYVRLFADLQAHSCSAAMMWLGINIGLDLYGAREAYGLVKGGVAIVKVSSASLKLYLQHSGERYVVDNVIQGAAVSVLEQGAMHRQVEWRGVLLDAGMGIIPGWGTYTSGKEAH